VVLVRQARASFAMLDGFRGIRGTGADPQTARQFLYDMGTALSIQGATTVITSEAQPRDATLFPEATTAADAFDLGTRLQAALALGGGLTLLRVPPVELDADIVAERLLDALDRTGARVLVVDSIAELERAAARSGDVGRVDEYLGALVEALRARGVTALFIKETRRILASAVDVSADAISVSAENVLLLQQVTYHDRLHHVLSVLKMRFSPHDVLLREFIVTPPAGIQVLAPLESGANLLAGIARQQGEPTGRENGDATSREGSR